VKTTIELSDTLLRRAKAASALCDESKGFVTAALRTHLESQATGAPKEHGWRSVLGKASSDEVEELDRIISEELERIDLDSWR
jgi:Arc/MetJ family transcription regulator